MKRFNTTGLCIPEDHYMCDVSKKFERCRYLIAEGFYYTITFPRQFGKTTMKSLLRRHFSKKDEYLVISTSFEGIGDLSFESEVTFASSVLEIFAQSFRLKDRKLFDFLKNKAESINNFKDLSEFLTDWILDLDKKVVLIIDEIDKASNNQVFVSFLAMLRDKYLKMKEKEDATFHSVVLLGVHDVKSLKLKIRPQDERKLNSPWNIAENLEINFSFSADEMIPMLKDYADVYDLGMNIEKIAERIDYYTNGNPYLSSLLCKLVDENITNGIKRNWTIKDIDEAYKSVIDGDYTNTNFDSITKNLENNNDLYNLIYDIVIQGKAYRFNVSDPLIYLGKTYGIISKKKNGHCDISNKIYEFRIIDYMLSKEKTREAELYLYNTSKFVKNEKLDIPLILEKFQLFMKENHSSKDNKFLEKNGRLLLMSFLRPVINGKGFLFKENVSAEGRKMDLVVTYNFKRYIIELKIWYGEKYIQDGIEQLCTYLEDYSLEEGAILIFNFNKNKKYEIKRFKKNNKKITAVFV